MWDSPDDRAWASFILVCIAAVAVLAFYWLADLASQVVSAIDLAAKAAR